MAKQIKKTTKKYGGADIQALDVFEGIRRNPGMYAGDNGAHGLHHLLFEIVDNANDEAMNGYASTVSVVIKENGTAIVKDDGRGFPVEWRKDHKMSAMTLALTSLHAGGKFSDGSSYSASGGLHGVGTKVAVAFSEWFLIQSFRYGVQFAQRLENGGQEIKKGVEIFQKGTRSPVGVINAKTELVLTKKNLLTRLKIKRSNQVIKITPDPKMPTGTIISFRPNREWFQKSMEWPQNSVPWNHKRIDQRLRQLSFLYPGTKFVFEDQRSGEKIIYEAANGLLDYIEWLTDDSKPLHQKPIIINAKVPLEADGDDHTLKIQIAIQYTDADNPGEIYAFTNAIPNPQGGKHVEGLRTAMTKAFKAYAKKSRSLKGVDFKGEDLLWGMTAILAIEMTSTPTFTSQTKENLSSAEVYGPIHAVVYEYLMETFFAKKSNSAIINAIIKQAQGAASGRAAAAKARKLIVTSVADSPDLAKLSDVTRRRGQTIVPLEHTALYIVEGNSAGGTAIDARQRAFHAILPLRGKPKNTHGLAINKILDNKEVKSLVAAIGGGIGSDFTPETMRYGRIVILTDADVDGWHIAVLLMGFFINHMRALVDSGRLFIAVPPLYQVQYKDKKIEPIYAYNDTELQDLLEESKKKKQEVSHVQRYKGLGEMAASQLAETVLRVPEDIVELDRDNLIKLDRSPFPNEHLLQVRIEDPHETKATLERLLGKSAQARKDWLMSLNWPEAANDIAFSNGKQ